MPAQTAQLLEQQVQVFFRDGQAFAREGDREWPIAEVPKDQLLWAPDGLRFAYLKARPPSYQVVIRNVRGDSVNAFSVYRPGRPADLEWLDDRQLAYQAPPDESGDAYVVHSARTGDVLRVYRGEGFAWSPGRKRLAYVSGKTKRQVIKVDERQVWPRRRVALPVMIASELVWSPDGDGLAFLERLGGKTRLVVILAIDDQGGDLTWDLPRSARGENANKLFWARNKVLIGESTLKPRFAASWTRLQ